MSGTADKPTPLTMPWHEALKRAGSFEALRPYFHQGLILVTHHGLYSLSTGELAIPGPGIIKLGRWFTALEDRPAQRVVFHTSGISEFGTFFVEELFAYTNGLEVDRAAFETFFPVTAEPPLEPDPPPPADITAVRTGESMPEPASAVEPELVPPAEEPLSGPPPPAAPAAVSEKAEQLPALTNGAKSKPKDQQLVLDVAGEVFPDGWESLSTGMIYHRVNQKLRERNLKAMSRPTVSRALGRRRK